jgi:hypothetical protein
MKFVEIRSAGISLYQFGLLANPVNPDLPSGKTSIVTLPAMQATQLKFACGMGMYRGLLVVK